MALRVGAEDKKKVIAASALVAVLVVVALLELPALFGGGSSPAPPPAATTAAPAAAPAPARAAGAPDAAFPHQAVEVASASALDPTLHPEVMAQAEDTTYKGNGRNIFSPDSAAPAAIPKPVASARPSAAAAAALAQGPPPPPAIDLKFYGYSAQRGGPREIFLLHGDDIFLAHEGDVVDRRYRVVAIQPFAVQIEDIPYHNTQTVPLTQN